VAWTQFSGDSFDMKNLIEVPFGTFMTGFSMRAAVTTISLDASGPRSTAPEAAVPHGT
jgi:hypothetical protein